MTLRLRYLVGGGHVHVRFYLAPGRPERPGQFVFVGELTFTVEEWPQVQAAFRHSGCVHVEKIEGWS